MYSKSVTISRYSSEDRKKIDGKVYLTLTKPKTPTSSTMTLTNISLHKQRTENTIKTSNITQKK